MLTPIHDQTIRNNRGLIPIQIELNRKLGIGEQLQLMLDGRRYGAPQTQPTWELKGIDRGTHTLQFKHIEAASLLHLLVQSPCIYIERRSSRPMC